MGGCLPRNGQGFKASGSLLSARRAAASVAWARPRSVGDARDFGWSLDVAEVVELVGGIWALPRFRRQLVIAQLTRFAFRAHPFRVRLFVYLQYL